MDTAPESYLDARRPPLEEAMRLEGPDRTIDQITESLTKKCYFTPHPRPWKVGVRDRGMGRADYAVLDRFGDLVAEMTREDAELTVSAVNAESDTRR